MKMAFSRRSWTIGIAIIVVAIVVAGVILLRAQTSQPAAPTPGAIKAALLRTTKIAIPPVVTSTTIATKQLPLFMKAVISPEAIGAVARAVLYSGSLRGYEITYTDPEPIPSAYFSFSEGMGSGGWLPTHGLRGVTFAYFEFSGNGLVGRAEFTVTDDASSTDVLIRVMQ
jgi:hypothetical protein